jgi:hypothetical protein
MLKTEHPIQAEELMAYLDGELEIERASVAAEHLERCTECRTLANDLRGVSRELMAWEVERCEVEVGRGKVRRRWGWWWKGAAAVAMAAVVVGVMAVRKPGILHDISPETAPPVPASSNGKLRQFRTGDTFAATLRAAGLAEQSSDTALVEVGGPLIARTAELNLAAKDFTHAKQQTESAVKLHNGYIGDMTANSGPSRSLTAQLYVPQAELAHTMEDLRKIGRVLVEKQTGEDVTSQSADLDARLANSRITEQRLKELLRARTGKLSEVLEAEREVARVRGEIEHMESQRKRLTTRVTFVTISVSITDTAEDGSLGVAARDGWRNLTSGITGAAEFVLTAGPSILVWGGALGLIAWAVWRRVRPRA